ncbi:CoA pyrophosphatase [Vibrio gallicus]|uniref:CoA pyrophosphatase n=1 Tax=Vibrio gallicus TaxID=190897 RepID=UPI0021C34CAC|nr:CoA pyrophosphatase [Vibrio gallicus]
MRRFNFSSPQAYDSISLQRLLPIQTETLRPAAVLIGLVERSNGLHVLLTKRAAHLKHHPGQISFPGGKYEPQDGQLRHTATRETCEEVGLEPHQIKIIGALPPIPTVSQFAVSPFVALIDSNYSTSLDHNEVEEAFEVPAAFLFSPKNTYSNHFELRHSQHKIFAISYQRHFIWGVTAQIIEAIQRQLA